MFEDTELKPLQLYESMCFVLWISSRTLCKPWEWHLGKDRMTLSISSPFPSLGCPGIAGKMRQAQTPNVEGLEHHSVICLANPTLIPVSGSEISKTAGSLGYPEPENRTRKHRG